MLSTPSDPVCLLCVHTLKVSIKLSRVRVGLVMMQLAIPKLRTAANIKAFNTQLRKQGHDLMAWKQAERLSQKETALLDAADGAGWDLASALLRPRNIQARLQDPASLDLLEYIHLEVDRVRATLSWLLMLEGSQTATFCQGVLPGQNNVLHLSRMLYSLALAATKSIARQLISSSWATNSLGFWPYCQSFLSLLWR